MVGVTDGEYFPCTPSLTASLPFGPEYLGKSYLPLSMEKCRCPWPLLAGLPTAAASSLMSVTLTLAVTVDGEFDAFLGARKVTLAWGCWSGFFAIAGDVLVVFALVLCLPAPPPQPASATTPAAVRSATGLGVMR